MSSACVCHLNEWCFHCEMYLPLLNRAEQAEQDLQETIAMSKRNVEVLQLEIAKLKEENKRLDIAAHVDISLGNTVAEMNEEIESLKDSLKEWQGDFYSLQAAWEHEKTENSRLKEVLQWIKKQFEEDWTYELGTGEVVDEIIQSFENAINRCPFKEATS